MRFSIIIPVRAVNEFLIENFSHLKRLDYADFEVIVLLDADTTYNPHDDRIKFFAVDPKGPGEKRNIGAELATGDILVFLDDDAYPARNWLTQASKIFSDDAIYAVGGPAMTPHNAGLREKAGGRVLESFLASFTYVYRHLQKPAREIDDYPTVNFFVRRSAFEAVDGFSTEFWPGEDTALCLALRRHFNRDFIYDPRPVVFHHRRELFRPHLKQVSRYGQHRGQFARILPDNSRLPGYFVPSLFVLGLIFGPLLAILFSFLWPVYFSVLLLYLVLLTIEAVRIGFKDKSLEIAIFVFVGIFFTHIVYGVNFIRGFLIRPKLKLKRVDKVSGNYAEG